MGTGGRGSLVSEGSKDASAADSSAAVEKREVEAVTMARGANVDRPPKGRWRRVLDLVVADRHEAPAACVADRLHDEGLLADRHEAAAACVADRLHDEGTAKATPALAADGPAPAAAAALAATEKRASAISGRVVAAVVVETILLSKVKLKSE